MCREIEAFGLSPAILAFVAVIAGATSASAQSPTTSYQAAIQSQNPLSPLYSLLNESSANFNFGPLDRTQSVLLVEPVIPVRLTPNFNLVMRWITPLVRQPILVEPFGPFPGIGPEAGLGNITPQFFFTPAHEGNGFVWGLGFNGWLPTATDEILGINEWGGGPTAVGLWIQGPLLFGVLANQTWAGDQDHGSSATLDRIDQMSLRPFVFYNLPGGWYVASLPLITADWTVPNRKWTVPMGGGIGRVIPVGDKILNFRFDYYNNIAFGLGDAEGITNVGDWTLGFTVHFVLPTVRAPSLF